jgi:hypothetical protein
MTKKKITEAVDALLAGKKLDEVYDEEPMEPGMGGEPVEEPGMEEPDLASVYGEVEAILGNTEATEEELRDCLQKVHDLLHPMVEPEEGPAGEEEFTGEED